MKAIISLIVFLICSGKILFVNYWHIIHLDRRTNGVISWYVLLPLAVVGFILALLSIANYFSSTKKLADLVIAIPMFLFGCYFFTSIIKAALS